jgi:hypothetical protein
MKMNAGITITVTNANFVGVRDAVAFPTVPMPFGAAYMRKR